MKTSARPVLAKGVSQWVQRSPLDLCHHSNIRNSTISSAKRLSWRYLQHSRQRPHDHNSHCNLSRRNSLHSTWMEDLARIRLESLQASWCGSEGEEDVRHISSLSLHHEVRLVHLRRILRSVDRISTTAKRLGVVSHLCCTSIFSGSTHRRLDCGTKGKQIHDDQLYCWLH